MNIHRSRPLLYLPRHAVDCTIVINALTIFIESARAGGSNGGVGGNTTSGGMSNDEFSVWNGIEATFTFLYCAEMLLKLWTYGCAGYWRSPRHRFDGIITLASIIAEVVSWFVINSVFGKIFTKIVMLVRLTRILRLLVMIKRFNLIFSTFMELIPAFSTLFGMMWALFLLYGELGVNLFGGRVWVNRTELLSTPYGEDEYVCMCVGRV